MSGPEPDQVLERIGAFAEDLRAAICDHKRISGEREILLSMLANVLEGAFPGTTWRRVEDSGDRVGRVVFNHPHAAVQYQLERWGGYMVGRSEDLIAVIEKVRMELGR